MDVLLIIIVALAFWHYAWDGIIAPSTRSIYRYDLFALRDKVRRIKLERPLELTDEQFLLVNELINASIYVLPKLTHFSMKGARRSFESNEQLRNRIHERIAIIESCQCSEVQDIVQKVCVKTASALFINHGAWLIPLACIALPLGALGVVLARVREILALSERELQAALPVPAGLSAIAA